MGPTLTCPDCQMIPRLTREHRGQHFLARATPQEESEDLELDVVDVGDSGSEVTSSRFSLPWDQAGLVPMEDEEDASLTGGPTLRSARIDFPAVMTLAAEHAAATEACKPPEIGDLRPGTSGAADLRFAPAARGMAVCGGDMAAAIKKAPIAAMAGLVKVVDRSDTTCPGVPPPSMRAWRPICFRGWLGGG